MDKPIVTLGEHTKTRYEGALGKAWREVCERYPSLVVTPLAKDMFEMGFGYGGEFGLEVGKVMGVASVGRVETEVRDARG